MILFYFEIFIIKKSLKNSSNQSSMILIRAILRKVIEAKWNYFTGDMLLHV